MGIGIPVGEYTLGLVVTAFAWLIANWAYVDFRRTGQRGFKRLVAFWMGWPATFLSLLVVREGSQPKMLGDDSGLDELMDEIRQDRLKRGDERPAVGGPGGDLEEPTS